MIPPDLEALALADAAGALDAQEREELRARLEALPSDVRAEVQALYELSVALAASVPTVEPPSALRERILSRASGPGRYTLAASEGQWNESGLPGIRVKVLAVDDVRGLVTMLLRAEPGARYPSHSHSTPEECYVISGTVTIDGRILHAGDFHHADADSQHGEITTTDGAEVLLVGGIADYMPGRA